MEYRNNPFAYGTIDFGGTGTDFCCDGTDMGTTTAVHVIIEADGGDDVICLQDANVGDCLDELFGVQMWDATADIEGQGGADQIYTCPTGEYDDYVYGGNDGDTIKTYDGDDYIEGNGGEDEIEAGAGVDTVLGGSQLDIIAGNGGADVLEGGDEGDTIRGGAGVDKILGGGGVDTLYGGGGNDTLLGEAAADSLYGEGDDDCLCGGSAGTGLNADSSNDTLDGGAGTGDDCYFVDTYPEEDALDMCEDEFESTTCSCSGI